MTEEIELYKKIDENFLKNTEERVGKKLKAIISGDAKIPDLESSVISFLFGPVLDELKNSYFFIEDSEEEKEKKISDVKKFILRKICSLNIMKN
jgi:hypothetical protein